MGEGNWVWMMRGRSSAVYCGDDAAIGRFLGVFLEMAGEIQSIARNPTHLPTNLPFPLPWLLISESRDQKVTRGNECVWTWSELLCLHVVCAVSGYGPCVSRALSSFR